MNLGILTLYIVALSAIIYMWYLIIVAAIAAGTIWTVFALWLIIQLIGVYLRAFINSNPPD